MARKQAETVLLWDKFKDFSLFSSLFHYKNAKECISFLYMPFTCFFFPYSFYFSLEDVKKNLAECFSFTPSIFVHLEKALFNITDSHLVQHCICICLTPIVA